MRAHLTKGWRYGGEGPSAWFWRRWTRYTPGDLSHKRGVREDQKTVRKVGWNRVVVVLWK